MAQTVKSGNFFYRINLCDDKELQRLDAHEVDKAYLPSPECMKDEYTLPDEEVRRLQNACTVWNYEKHWVEASLQGHGDSGCTKEYIDYGNEDFNADDGTPISLKALLWNRYYHWGGGCQIKNPSATGIASTMSASQPIEKNELSYESQNLLPNANTTMARLSIHGILPCLQASTIGARLIGTLKNNGWMNSP